MHRPATVEAAPSTENEASVPTRLADHILLLQRRRYILNRELCAGQSRGVFKQHYHMLQQTIFGCTAVLNSIRGGPMGHGGGCGDGSCIDWRPRRLVRVFPAL